MVGGLRAVVFLNSPGTGGGFTDQFFIRNEKVQQRAKAAVDLRESGELLVRVVTVIARIISDKSVVFLPGVAVVI
jgi:hypothetical protein